MSDDTKALIGGGVILALIVGGIIWLFSTVDWDAYNSYTPPAQSQTAEAKPQTKTRCDFTGWASSSIIEEEATNGYRFTGRVSQPFCENSLSFELKEVTQ